VSREFPAKERQTTLLPGDTAVVFSDGLLEIVPSVLDGEFLREVCGACHDPVAIVDRLVAGAPAHLEDDLTILALRREPTR
jgi:serine phosphatase RsbU (regulator of sigma subunit)